MAITCFLAEPGDKRPGAIWPLPHIGPGSEDRAWAEDVLLSIEYLRDHAERDPLCLRLPDGSHWVMDCRAAQGNETGWTITGEAPVLTASPSINTGRYHGWLIDGVLSEDLDGRRYPS
jgi:hypothetical protein